MFMGGQPMWTSKELKKGIAMLSDGRLTFELTFNEYITLYYSIQMLLGVIHFEDYQRELCAWQFGSEKVHLDIITRDPHNSNIFILRLRRDEKMRIEYRLGRDEVSDILNDFDAPGEGNEQGGAASCA
jgi:hypothetical protein